MKKGILVCFMMAALAGSAMAAGATAFVDTQTVFEKSKLGKKYQVVVREYFESRKKILDAEAAEIQKLQDDYQKQKQAKLLNEKAQKGKEEAIAKKIAEFRKKQEEFSAEVGKKNEELSNDFSQKMMVVLKSVAKKEKVSLILTKSINVLSRAEVPSVLYADEELDLTERVIVEMDKREPEK
jgi:Skp family chaperone for outer membrane proteins